MTLARDWDFRDCAGWFWSEKFDGCRAYWDGTILWTRGGNVINAPDWFRKALPAGVHLDGEIWCGRGGYIEAMNAVRHGLFTENCRFVAFDLPQCRESWLKRIGIAKRFSNSVVSVCASGKIGFRDEPSILADEIIRANGEGIMLRSPFVKRYEAKRTSNLMRVKAKNLFAPWHGMKDNRNFKSFLGKLAFNPEIAWRVEAAL